MRIQVGVAWDDAVDANLGLLATLGVDDIGIRISRDIASIELMTPAAAASFFQKAAARVASHGMRLRTAVAVYGWEELKLGGPGAEDETRRWLNMIHGMGAAGISLLVYNFKVLNSHLLRTEEVKGRGQARYKAFDYEEYLKRPQDAGMAVSAEQMQQNLHRFLEQAIPAAQKANVRMALHPDDPPLPAGIRPLTGVANITSTLGQFRNIFDTFPSPSNAMLFCQGCAQEMQDVDVYDAIRQIGALDKIALVHFRNVKGAFPRFVETFVDDGDVDMYKAMAAYRDAGFKGPFMLDHCPDFAQAEVAGTAFAVGYIRGLIQSVYR